MKQYPFWLDTLSSADLTTETGDLRSDERVDVLIVGSGYTGLAAARHLARVGASVLVVEREQIGWGASSRNGGQVLSGLKLDPGTLVGRYGEARARCLFETAAESIRRVEQIVADEAIDCGFARTGHIQAAWKPAHFAAFRDEQALLARVFGHRVEIVPPANQRSELGTDAYHGLLVDEHSAAINPAQYVHGLARAAVRAGTRAISGVAVRSTTRSSGGWIVHTTAGDVRARDVLFATNGYTDRAAPALQRRLIPIGSYIIVTEPLAPRVADAILPRKRMAFDTKHFLYYFRVTDDRRLLFGGRAEFSRPGPRTTHRAAAILREGMVDVFPELASAAIEYAWGGQVAFTRDQMPHAGTLDGAYFAGGYCGHGIAMSTMLGELIARRIAGEPIEHPLMSDRFDAIPLYNGRPWFLPLVGAYYRLRDYVE